MADVRDGMADPYRVSAESSATLRPEKPEGSEIVLNDDGTATFNFDDDAADKPKSFSSNIAESLDHIELGTIATDLLDQIEVDKQARTRRDDQYAEGLRRTGLGSDNQGGAPFAGASKVTHPALTEGTVDYSARVCSEMLPPEGPVKPRLIGEPTNDKSSRGERVARYMNYQLTVKCPSFYSEMEVGFSQEALAGAFFVKPAVKDGRPDFEVVHMDMVHRPWNDGDFYSQQRITHEMAVDKWTFAANVRAKLWIDEIDPATATDNVKQSQASQTNDRIIGRDTPTENIDDVRTVYEVSTIIQIGDDKEPRPYLVTIDEQTRKVLAIYRNWREKDANRTRLDYMIEFPFLPWRGGYPIGLGHMIGGLSGAASGALRGLLDAAFLNATQTGVKLKGGTTAGGQNIRVNPSSTTELAGSLAADPDVRKTYMPLPFPPPSPTLFQLLGFLVDAARGVVRTTFDEFNKMNGEMPVGTANMMIEQGLKTFGSVFARQHRAMGRLLQCLWYINAETVENEAIIDEFGELLVTKEDFTGPMQVAPVSDPRVFSDTQRMAGAQMLVARADAHAQNPNKPNPYKERETELNLLRAAKIPSPEQYLQAAPQPAQINAAAENVAASQGLPIKSFPGQDHEAHIAQHAVYMNSEFFGSNPVLALKFLPIMLQHVAEHMSMWYADAMLLATNELLRSTFNDERITLDALATVKGLEVQLDRLMAEVTPEVMQTANEALKPALEVVKKAQELMKQLQPPMPMDPSIVAQQDVKRQAEADKAKAEKDKGELTLRAQDQQTKAGERGQTLQQKAAKEQADIGLKAQQMRSDDAHKAADREARRQQASDSTEAQLHGIDTNADVQLSGQDTQQEIADANNDVKLAITEMDNENAKDIAEKEIKSGEKVAVSTGKDNKK